MWPSGPREGVQRAWTELQDAGECHMGPTPHGLAGKGMEVVSSGTGGMSQLRCKEGQKLVRGTKGTVGSTPGRGRGLSWRPKYREFGEGHSSATGTSLWDGRGSTSATGGCRGAAVP